MKLCSGLLLSGLIFGYCRCSIVPTSFRSAERLKPKGDKTLDLDTKVDDALNLLRRQIRRIDGISKVEQGKLFDNNRVGVERFVRSSCASKSVVGACFKRKVCREFSRDRLREQLAMLRLEQAGCTNKKPTGYDAQYVARDRRTIAAAHRTNGRIGSIRFG